MGDILSSRESTTSNNTENRQAAQQGQVNKAITGDIIINGAAVAPGGGGGAPGNFVIDMSDTDNELATAAIEAVARGTNQTIIAALSNAGQTTDRSIEFARSTQEHFADLIAPTVPVDAGQVALGTQKLVIVGAAALLIAIFLLNRKK